MANHRSRPPCTYLLLQSARSRAGVARGPTPLPKSCHQRLLSWDSPHVPLCRIPLVRPLPRPRPIRLDGANRRNHGPSPWFCTTSTVYSAPRVAGLLHPADGCEVHRVSGQAPRAVARVGLAFPAMRFTPFEDFPSPAAAPHHCDPCTSCRYRSARVGGTSHAIRCRMPQPAPPQRRSRLQGVAPLTSPLRLAAVSSDLSPVPSMGLVPLQDPPDFAPARPSREATHRTNPMDGCLEPPALQRVAAPVSPRASLQCSPALPPKREGVDAKGRSRVPPGAF
jgi:hypothetical protein